MPYFSRRTKIILVFIIIIAAGYGIVAFWQSQNQIPVAFTNARSQGAIIAQNIVNLSNQSDAELQQVNAFDEQGNYGAALSSTEVLIAQSTDLRNQAVALSDQVGQMTTALSDINSVDAQQAALESISSRLALINELVTYSGDLGNLLNTLRDRFVGDPASGTSIQALVNQINTDVNAINNFNAQADTAMDQFDKIVGKS